MRRALAIAALGLGLFAAGCGGTDDSTPVACLDGSGAYLGALGDAPGEVRLSGEVPISDCLAENQTAGDLATVGAAMLGAATELNAEARAEPGGRREPAARLPARRRPARRREQRRDPRRADPPPLGRGPLQPRQPPPPAGVLPGISIWIRCRSEKWLNYGRP